MPLSETELVSQVLNWVRTHKNSGVPENVTITEETDLLGAGLLDSLGLIDLIMFMISLGFDIDLASIDPSEFSMVKSLCANAMKGLPA